jgi:hypothetical protein
VEKLELECTLDKVVTARKKDGILGQLTISWNVRDFTKITKLSQMQNSIIRVTVKDPQQELFDETKKDEDQSEMNFDGQEVPVAENVQPLMISGKVNGCEDVESVSDETKGDQFDDVMKSMEAEN